MKTKLSKEEIASLKMFLEGKPVTAPGERSTSLYIRVSPSEKKHIENIAEAAQLSVSEVIRRCAMNVRIRAFPNQAVLHLESECEQLVSLLQSTGRETKNRIYFRVAKQVDHMTGFFKKTLEDIYGEDLINLIRDRPEGGEDGCHEDLAD